MNLGQVPPPGILTSIICFIASEVNRLKLIVDDLKVSHEEKDNAISRVQIEIERLREVCDPVPCRMEFLVVVLTLADSVNQ